MFCFLGAFSSPSTNLEREFARLWPDADFNRIESPIDAIAVRLTARTKPSDEGELPSDIVDALKALSIEHPRNRFLLLRADCWGGDCFYNGNTIEAGSVQEVETSDQSLRQMVQFLGADIGERQVFAPLRRDFAWHRFSRSE